MDEGLDCSEVECVERLGGLLRFYRRAAAYEFRPLLSPDGERLTSTIRGFNDDVWIFDLGSGRRERVSFHESEDESSIWSPDGSRVAYSGERERRVIVVRSVEGAGEEQVIRETDHHLHLLDWTPDGETILYVAEGDIWALPLAGGPPEVRISTPGTDRVAAVSQDDRWVAYVSNESGISEVYVRGFATPGGPWQVSTGGGNVPRWSRDGRELFFVRGAADEASLMTVSVKSGPGFRWEPARSLFVKEGLRNSDVGPKADTFVLHTYNPEAKIRQIHVVANWATPGSDPQ